jgi:glycosyltransferase involved in cell wall biosynthesis
VIFGEGRGQVEGHRTALKEAKGEFIWRLDDDNVPEPDVLEKLMKNFEPDVGAVGGLVLDPGKVSTSSIASNKIEDIYLGLNVQWFRQDRKIEVDHLYSTFVYRKDQDYYPTGLSRVGHREETIMTYRMRRQGWRLIVDPGAITWHLRGPTGGIRGEKGDFWAKDEQIFSQMLIDWGVRPTIYKTITLDNGIGDHYAFRKVLPKILSRYPNFILACCYPDVFSSFPVRIVSIGEARAAGWGDNIYRFMVENNWKGNIVEAYEKYYC